MRRIPESSSRSDWPRLVAQTVNAMITRVLGLEEATDTVRTTVTFTPTTEPGSPVAGMTYFDSGTLKLRTHDGTNWNDHW